MINVFHFLVVGPLLAYIGWIGVQGQIIPEWTFQVLLGMGVLATAYHFFRYNRRVEGMIVTNDEKDATFNEGFASVAGPSEAVAAEQQKWLW